MIVLLLLTYFIINDDIGLQGGSLYTTNMTQTFHMFIYTISILMLQLTSSSGSNSLNTRAFGSKSNTFYSLNPYFVHPIFSPSQPQYAQVVFYSSHSSPPNSLFSAGSRKIYANAEIHKLKIVKENKGKGGYIAERISRMVKAM